MSRGSEVVVVTPEHVEIVLTPAGLGSRFLALTIDAMITILLPLLVVRLAGPALTPEASFAIGTTLTFFFTFAYHVFFETRRQGRTIGKRALRLRVVDSRGLPITPAQSLVRNAVRALDSIPYFYAVGGLVSLIDRSGRRLGDMVAQTLVVEEQTPLAYQGTSLSARQFNSLRTPRILRLVRHRIGMEERELLLELSMRADQLEPQKRYQIMEEVGGYYRRLLGIDDTRLTGENLVRDLTSILFTT